MKKLFSKNQILSNINTLLFFVYAISYLIIIEFYRDNSFIFDLKHYILFFNCLVAGFTFLIKKDKKKIKLYGNKVVYILLTGCIFVICSFFKAKSVGVAFSFRTFVQTSLFVLPILYVYFLVNILEKKRIINILKITTFILIISYFTEMKHPLFSFFNIDNWLNIDILKSRSFTESNNCCDPFLQLFIFFNYLHRFVEPESKSIHRFMIINFIFSILSFKRLSLLFAILFLVSSCFIPYNKNNKIKLNIILSSFFVVLTILYIKMLTGEINVGIDMNSFTSYRSWFLSLWRAKNYYSYGYGTSIYVIGRYLEMDLVQIYFELGLICLFIFCFSMFQLAGKRIYTNIILFYVMLNLLTSSTMPWTLGWVILGLNLFTLSDDYFDVIRKAKVKKNE